MDMTKKFENFLKVYYRLIRTSQRRDKVTYGEIARIMKLPERGNYMSNEVGQLLGEISEWEHNQGRPMLSAVAVRQDAGNPGKGFFILAKDLNKLSEGEDENKFWQSELDAVYAKWD